MTAPILQMESVKLIEVKYFALSIIADLENGSSEYFASRSSAFY